MKAKAIQVAVIDVFLGALIAMTIVFYVVAKSEASDVPQRRIPSRTILDVEVERHVAFEISFRFVREEHPKIDLQAYFVTYLNVDSGSCGPYTFTRRASWKDNFDAAQGEVCIFTVEDDVVHYSVVLPEGKVSNVRLRPIGLNETPSVLPTKFSVNSLEIYDVDGKRSCTAPANIRIGEVAENVGC